MSDELYRIVDLEGASIPEAYLEEEVWFTRESAEAGLKYWQARFPQIKMQIERKALLERGSTLEGLPDKWRKIAADCPPEHKAKWVHVFEAANTMADELAAAIQAYKERLESLQRYSHQFDYGCLGLQPFSEGEWVKRADVLAALGTGKGESR